MACKVPEETQTSLTYQIGMIEICRSTFEKYLRPATVLDNMDLEATMKERIRAQESLERQKAVTTLLEAVLGDPEKNVPLFIYALRQTGFEHFFDVFEEDTSNAESNTKAARYEMFILMLEGELKDKIIPTEIIDDLKPILSDRDYELIRNLETERSAHDACQELFLAMPRKTPRWSLHFMNALYKAYGSQFTDKIHNVSDSDETGSSGDSGEESGDGEASTVSDCVMSTRTQQQTVAKVPVAEVFVPDIEMQEESTHTEQSESDSGRQPASESMEMSDDETEKDRTGKQDLDLRQYQLELAENAVKQRNTIICAPTGSGKTRVALYIVKDHLEKQAEAEADGKRKVVFLARTVPLVTQQYKTFCQFLGDKKYKILKLSGEDERSKLLHQLLDDIDIIVMTPMILENQMKDAKIKSLSVFSLIVLDECHHTRKGEPYNKLMIRYLKQKSKQKSKRLPQIVGLTASLGVEKATVDEEAIDNILKLCANMDAPYLSTVQAHIDELQEKVPVPDEKKVKLTENRLDHARKELENAMKTIEDQLIDINDLNNRKIDNLLMKRPTKRNSQSYGQWAVQLRNEARLVQTGTYSSHDRDIEPRKTEMARGIFEMADQLFKYNAALEIHEYVRIYDVVDYLQKELNIMEPRQNESRTDEELSKIFTSLKKKLIRYEQKRKDDPKFDNPNLKVLAKTLTDLLEAKGSDSRAIIFVRTRATCYALTNWLNEDERIDPQLKDLKAMAFTGAGANEEEGGMTQNEQDKVIAKFKSGQVKLIVATSVAEEGLDIPECNIVLKYNHVGNEITTLQTRGRSRKAGGTSVLLGCDKTQQKETLNLARAAMMERAVREILKMPFDRIQRRISKQQEEILLKEATKEVVQQHQLQQKLQKRFILKCGSCKSFCAHSKDLRVINDNQHVVIDREFEGRIEVRQFGEPKKPFDGITMTGRMQCKVCRREWGVMFLYQQVSFHSLGIKHFIVVDEETNQPKYYKKWFELPYTIRNISTEDFKTRFGPGDDCRSDEEEEG
ncbi:probable ATP-dependent RNA helicase DHX58 isoform X2 [Haliotis rubra]|uniref:probable ATP-dependent RNA helicase DHX58 isoform X2 n=1 Tax=Haliotis rubra TaxID=36100 RepID=UPI001EE4F231|nr:probable ATP-dependent RNA helicase DHX58 isoform X2 [Haliotis rubra]